MEILVDGEKDFEPPEGPVTLSAAIVEVCARVNEAGRAVLRITIDGAALSLDNFEEDLGEKSLSDAGLLEIQTESVLTLVASSIEELQEALSELPTICHQLAEVFQRGEAEEGFEKLPQLFDIWHAIKTREDQICRALHLEADRLTLDGATLPELHEGLNVELGKAVVALESQDTVALGDLLEYELAPKAEQESEIVGLLHDRLKERIG
jgi:hypothetical protein